MLQLLLRKGLPMKKKALYAATAALVCILLMEAGCQSYGQTAGLGALIGAGTGAAIGSARGEAGTGALIGAAVGGLAGLIAHDIRARRVRDQRATAADYNYQPAQGEVLRMENVQVAPSTVKPGNLVEASMQYALLGTGPSGVSVVETRQLREGPNVLAETSGTVARTDGTWVSTQTFQIPPSALPGQYTIVQTIQTPQSRVSGTSTFTVAP